MLMAQPTRSGAGLTLYGDYRDLKAVHETIHQLTDASPLSDEDPALEMAYEIRHAYQRMRDVKQVPSSGNLHIELLGCKMIWPAFLFELRWLRGFAAVRPTTLKEQADLFQLEACAESALKQADADVAEPGLTWLARAQRPSRAFLPLYLSEVGRQFVSIPGKRKRLAALPRLLASLEMESIEYGQFSARIRAIADAKGCRPGELQATREWPDFRW